MWKPCCAICAAAWRRSPRSTRGQVAEICGHKARAQVALLGAVARQGALPIALEDVERALRTKLSGAVLEMNLKALEFGANAKEDPQCK